MCKVLRHALRTKGKKSHGFTVQKAVLTLSFSEPYFLFTLPQVATGHKQLGCVFKLRNKKSQLCQEYHRLTENRGRFVSFSSIRRKQWKFKYHKYRIAPHPILSENPGNTIFKIIQNPATAHYHYCPILVRPTTIFCLLYTQSLLNELCISTLSSSHSQNSAWAA